MPQYTFKKSERITSRLLQDQLFHSKESKSVTAYPVKAVFLRVSHHEDDAPVQILVSVPKRLFKRAVKRNRIKRQIREAYRLNKAIIPTPPEGQQLLIAFVYMSDRIYTTQDIEARVVKILNKIAL